MTWSPSRRPSTSAALGFPTGRSTTPTTGPTPSPWTRPANQQRATTSRPTRPHTAEIATVESVTGVKIDHFVETNLAGFYYLAQAFGGVEVCIKPQEHNINAANYQDSNLYDFNSGFNAVKYDGYKLAKGGAQYLHLAADQALAFVRERDNLPEGDMDRTHRQQAVIDYVIWKLKHENAFSDVGKLTGLLSAANQYLITD